MEEKSLIKVRKFRKVDFMLVTFFAFVWTVSNYFLTEYFYTSIMVMAALMTLVALLTRRVGCVTTFFIIGGILTTILNKLGIFALNNFFIISFILVGVLFEMMLFLVRERAVNIILGAGFSTATIPWTSLLVVGLSIERLTLEMLNFSLVCFFVAAFGGIISLLIWELIRNTKFVLKLMYGQV